MRTNHTPTSHPHPCMRGQRLVGPEPATTGTVRPPPHRWIASPASPPHFAMGHHLSLGHHQGTTVRAAPRTPGHRAHVGSRRWFSPLPNYSRPRYQPPPSSLCCSAASCACPRRLTVYATGSRSLGGRCQLKAAVIQHPSARGPRRPRALFPCTRPPPWLLLVA